MAMEEEEEEEEKEERKKILSLLLGILPPLFFSLLLSFPPFSLSLPSLRPYLHYVGNDGAASLLHREEKERDPPFPQKTLAFKKRQKAKVTLCNAGELL